MPDGGNVGRNHQLPERPAPEGARRLRQKERIRRDAGRIDRPEVTTIVNGEETAQGDARPVQFTKGLQHDAWGMLSRSADYLAFVTAINEEPKRGHGGFSVAPADAQSYVTRPNGGGAFAFRGWESPRAGHAYDLSGPDGDEVGMAPAPRLGGSELTAEMAELYGLALLRDVPFTRIAAASTLTGPANVSPCDVISALNRLSYFAGREEQDDLDTQARRRRSARFADGAQALSGASVFRGSTAGAKTGPYLSQFLLIGGADAPERGLIPFGAQRIDQRSATFVAGRDYLGDWFSWLDVQNGADTRGQQKADRPARFLTTPRDLAAYVRVDALYQAYLNAGLILLDHGADLDPGFPTGNGKGVRDSFATFGGPDLLAVLTMVSSVALKAVRRQKFNYHRRCRPERIGGLLTLCRNGEDGRLGPAGPDAQRMLAAHETAGIAGWIADLNARQLAAPSPIDGRGNPGGWAASVLLPMAFVEGSPMHPAYGAGHATVAGACVTVLKAFFDTFRSADGWDDKPISEAGMARVFVPDEDGKDLVPVQDCPPLTINGELDKLAANISIGRNMAGVHYYSDYYDSLRMGERIAVGMLQERLLSYQEPLSIRLRSFDDDQLRLTSAWSARGRMTSEILVNEGRDGFPEWWTRHVPQQEA